MNAAHVTADGSPVAVYLAAPAGDVPELIHGAIPDGADILELGCGAGRVTRVLLAFGHPVVAVDDDDAMLAHVTGARTVRADIYDLDLGRRFGAVVAASYFVNRPDPADRRRLLATCARHVDDGGTVLVERYPPVWSMDPTPSSGRLGPVEVSVHPEKGADGAFTAVTEYRLGTRVWRQRFAAVHVSDGDLAAAAGEVGLELTGWLDDNRSWARLARAARRAWSSGEAAPAGVR